MSAFCENKQQNADDQQSGVVREPYNGLAFFNLLVGGLVSCGIGCDGHEEEIAHSQKNAQGAAQEIGAVCALWNSR